MVTNMTTTYKLAPMQKKTITRWTVTFVTATFLLLGQSSNGQTINDSLKKADTTKSIYTHLDTIKIFNWGQSGCEGCGQPNAKYHIDNKPVSKATYDSCITDFDNSTIKCMPCYLKVYDKKSGSLIRESAQYTDAPVGLWIDYYQSGQIKTLGHFKENKTNKWENFSYGEDGVWKDYKQDGTVIKEEIWKNGKLISTK